jgi:cobalt/nickel transport system permease protein
MTLDLSPLPSADSVLRRLDPRWKLAGLLLLIATAALVQTLPAIGMVLGFSLGLAMLGRLTLRWYLFRVAPVALFLLLFTLPLPFLMRGEGPISTQGLMLALVIWGKALAVLTLVLVLLATGPLHDTLKAAHSLRVPGLLILLALLTCRYLYLLADELARLRIAVRVRGYRNRPSRHCYRTIGHVAGTLLVRGAERAERVHQAMRCRGFDGQFRTLTQFRTRAADVLAFLLLAALAGACWLLEVLAI